MVNWQVYQFAICICLTIRQFMVLIFSEKNDVSTNKVIDWLIHFNKRFVRVNNTDLYGFIKEVRLSNNASVITFRFRGESFRLSEITSVWFRRHFFQYKIHEKYVAYTKDENGYEELIDPTNTDPIRKNLEGEFGVLRDFVFSVLQHCPKVLGHWRENFENKLAVLNIAARVGLSIPDTEVIDSKIQLQAKYRRDGGAIITKALKYAPPLLRERLTRPISSYTSEIHSDAIASYPDHFFWSLVQQKIPKRFEIRAFYLDGHFYSMAIFSQENKQTAIDFRNYDWKRPNRSVPYQLPDDVEQKLNRLMQQLKLNTGSIDLIYTTSGEYVFLEVNPVGQFGMVSRPCNYHLEKKIARFLIS
jgi:ATP-GRASP peptide maturase of grasp-with-spasm system